MTKIIGHRGIPSFYPDNSLTGINASKEYCSAVEIDLRLTKDSEIILFHDPEINGFNISSIKYPEYNLPSLLLVNSLVPWICYKFV